MRLATSTDIDLSRTKDDLARIATYIEQVASIVAKNSEKPTVMLPDQRDVQTIPVPVAVPTRQPSRLEADIVRDDTGRASRIIITPYYAADNG